MLMRGSYMIRVFDISARKSCSKMLYVSSIVPLEKSTEIAEQFGFVSNMMKSDHAYNLSYFKGNFISLKWLSITPAFLFSSSFHTMLCLLEFGSILAEYLAELEPDCWYTLYTANYFGRSLSNMYALKLFFSFSDDRGHWGQCTGEQDQNVSRESW